MAKPGSTSCAFLKLSSAESYSKLCSSARPRRKSFCASGDPELAKATIPTSSPGRISPLC
jgi:hypothetical protein